MPYALLEVNPQNGFYKNPSTVTGIGDPFVLYHDGLYYMYATSNAAGYNYWVSEDMTRWLSKGACYLFYNSDNSWARDTFWAPEVVEKDGRFFMFYSGGYGDDRRSRIGVAVADHPAGPFLEAIGAPLVDPGQMVIDANLLMDDDGRNYLYYALDCSANRIDGKRTSQIYVVELAENLLSCIGEPILLLTPDQEWEMDSVDPLWNEGPEVVKHEGRYYLMYSANFYGKRKYAVGYAVSDRPDGGFVKASENPVLSAGEYERISGPGHHGILRTPYEWLCFYHSHTAPTVGGGNRQANVCTMGFRPDGTLYVNGPTIGWQPKPATKERHDLAYGVQPRINGLADETAALLTDGEFAVHKEQDALVWQGDAKANELVVELDLPQLSLIRSVVLYRAPWQDLSGLCARLSIDDLPEVEFPAFGQGEADLCAILNFEAIEGRRVTLRLTGAPALLSEIRVIGGEVE